jgi:hypothetical protein
MITSDSWELRTMYRYDRHLVARDSNVTCTVAPLLWNYAFNSGVVAVVSNLGYAYPRELELYTNNSGGTELKRNYIWRYVNEKIEVLITNSVTLCKAPFTLFFASKLPTFESTKHTDEVLTQCRSAHVS